MISEPTKFEHPIPVVLHEGKLFFKIREGFLLDILSDFELGFWGFLHETDKLNPHKSIDINIVILRDGSELDRGHLTQIGRDGLDAITGLRKTFGLKHKTTEIFNWFTNFVFRADVLQEGDIFTLVYIEKDWDIVKQTERAYRNKVARETIVDKVLPFKSGLDGNAMAIIRARAEMITSEGEKIVLPENLVWNRQKEFKPLGLYVSEFFRAS